MPNTKMYHVTAAADGSLYIHARLTDGVPTEQWSDTGTPVVEADIDTVDYQVIDMRTNEEVIPWSSITPSSVILDPLIGWQYDNIGYNFSHVLPPAAFPSQGWFQINYKFTLVGGAVFIQPITADTLKTAF